MPVDAPRVLRKNLVPAANQPAAAILEAKASKSQGRSLESFLASLTAAGGVVILELLLYVWLRYRLPSLYKSKTRSSIIPGGEFEGTLHCSDCHVITDCGLDAYLFLRYLKTLLRIFIPLAIIILPILIPLNLLEGRGTKNGVTGLDQVSWTNVSPAHTNRYWAHLSLAVAVVLWVCRVSRLELLSYTRLRHQYLASSQRLDRISTSTILITDIPDALLSVEQLASVYSVFPHGVRKISINRNFSKLARDVKNRAECALALEVAETRLIQKANLSHLRRSKRGVSSERPKTSVQGALWKEYMRPDERSKIRLMPRWASWLPSLPLLGDLVDEIDHRRRELNTLNSSISEAQQRPQTYPLTNSAFIQFNRPIAAHLACQVVQHYRPHTMTARPIEQSSENVLWQYVSMGWWEQYIRAFIVGSVIGTLIILCTVPVAFTGLLSQISYMIAVFPKLRWLAVLPDWALAALQGVMPACLLASIMILLPLLLYQLVLWHGIRTRVDAELLMQDYYFFFLFIQLFLVVSVASSIAAVLEGLTQDFTSVAALIAQNLPKAGNYFLSYMLLQGLSVSAGTLLQIGRLIFYFVGLMIDKTARQRWERQLDPEMRWGTFFPVYTNLAVIGLIYSVISPLILVFNIITFSLFLVVQRYNITHLAASHVDTGGLIYPKAINQLFVGLYAMELYLIGLFFLVRDEAGRVACVGQGVIMVVVTFLTAAYQVLLRQAFKPLARHLPIVTNKAKPKEHTTSDPSAKHSRLGRFTSLIMQAFEVFKAWMDQHTEEERALATIIGEERVSAKRMSQAIAMEDHSLLVDQPIIWLPRDGLGVSRDEIDETQSACKLVMISDDNAELNDTAAVHCYGGPPSASRD